MIKKGIIFICQRSDLLLSEILSTGFRASTAGGSGMDIGIIPWHKQPFKTLYITYLVTSLVLVKLPWWSLYFIRKDNRPSPTWSWKTCMGTRLIRSIYPFLIRGGLITSLQAHNLPPMSNDKIKEMGFNCHSVWVPPVEDEDLCGEIKEWKRKNDVTSVSIPGYWWKGQERNAASVGDFPPTPGEKVVIHFHGGAYVVSHTQLKCS